MESGRIIINERIDIPVRLARSYQGGPVLWSDLIKVTDVLPTDIVIGIGERVSRGGGWGMGQEDADEPHYYKVLVVERKRPETDDEYFNRMKKEVATQQSKDEEEKRLYLRLKAKFENENEK